MFQKSWVQIPVSHTGWIFPHLLVVKIVLFAWKDKNKQKKKPGWPIFKKKTIKPSGHTGTIKGRQIFNAFNFVFFVAGAASTTADDDASTTIYIVSGSRHQFEMSRLTSSGGSSGGGVIGDKSSVENVKLFALPSGGTNKAISITEVRTRVGLPIPLNTWGLFT